LKLVEDPVFAGKLESRNWGKMKQVYELDVYKLAEELSDRIWYDFDKWNKKVQNTIGYQIIRSSDSIVANIAEGYGRYTPADRKKFYLSQTRENTKQ